MSCLPCTRRAWLASALATLGTGASSCGARAAGIVQQRSVGGFDRLLWEAAGELFIEQGVREALTLEGEPEVLAMIRTEVRASELRIAFKPGRVVAREPLRFRLQLKQLAALHGDGSGAIRIGPLRTPALALRLAGSDTLTLARLDAGSLDATLAGAGELKVEAGTVQRQRIVISGAANYHAPRLASRTAEVSIDGSGEAWLAVSETLTAGIAGSGVVRYHGRPRVTQAITGAGEVLAAEKT